MYEALLGQVKGDDHSTSYAQLDHYRSEFEKWDEGQLNKLMGIQSHYAKLIVDYGDGLKESSALSRTIGLGNQQLDFQLDNEKDVSKLIFFPANGSCRIKIHKIDLDSLDQESSYEIFDNADINEGDFYTFHEVFPCLLYTSPSPRDRQKSRMPSSA